MFDEYQRATRKHMNMNSLLFGVTIFPDLIPPPPWICNCVHQTVTILNYTNKILTKKKHLFPFFLLIFLPLFMSLISGDR